MVSHLTKDPPTDDSKDRWLEDDARCFLQIHNSIDVNYFWCFLCLAVNLFLGFLDFFGDCL